MMNLTLYIFGAHYISRGKLAPTIGSLPAKPFGWGSSPCGGNPEAFLKVWPHWSSFDHPNVWPHWSSFDHPNYRVEMLRYTIFRRYISKISWCFPPYFNQVYDFLNITIQILCRLSKAFHSSKGLYKTKHHYLDMHGFTIMYPLAGYDVLENIFHWNIYIYNCWEDNQQNQTKCHKQGILGRFLQEVARR